MKYYRVEYIVFQPRGYEQALRVRYIKAKDVDGAIAFLLRLCDARSIIPEEIEEDEYLRARGIDPETYKSVVKICKRVRKHIDKGAEQDAIFFALKVNDIDYDLLRSFEYNSNIDVVKEWLKCYMEGKYYASDV